MGHRVPIFLPSVTSGGRYDIVVVEFRDRGTSQSLFSFLNDPEEIAHQRRDCRVAIATFFAMVSVGRRVQLRKCYLLPFDLKQPPVGLDYETIRLVKFVLSDFVGITGPHRHRVSVGSLRSSVSRTARWASRRA